jgi:hypothetical protein
MKPTGQNPSPGQASPQDSDTADAAASDRRYIPGADDRHTLDEDRASENRPLTAGATPTKKLHDQAPEGQRQLGIGTGGDAARPGKEGITGNPVPPRGNL